MAAGCRRRRRVRRARAIGTSVDADRRCRSTVARRRARRRRPRRRGVVARPRVGQRAARAGARGRAATTTRRRSRAGRSYARRARTHRRCSIRHSSPTGSPAARRGCGVAAAGRSPSPGSSSRRRSKSGCSRRSPQRVRLVRAYTPPAAGRGGPVRTRACAADAARRAGSRARVGARPRAGGSRRATIGIAIEDLATRREEVRALAEEILCPALQWPGGEEARAPTTCRSARRSPTSAGRRGARPRSRSRTGPLPAGRAAALLRSPYLGADDRAWPQRARARGRRGSTAAPATSCWPTSSPRSARRTRAGAGRWRGARDARSGAAASPRAMGGGWRGWLAAVGWPGAPTVERGVAGARGVGRAAG